MSPYARAARPTLLLGGDQPRLQRLICICIIFMSETPPLFMARSEIAKSHDEKYNAGKFDDLALGQK